MPTERPISRVTVLYAEDDPQDRLLARQAFAQGGFSEDLRFVEDGVELLDYLRRHGAYEDPGSSPKPALVLLDLRLPRKDGREVLSEMRQHPELRDIPVVVFTTSNDADGIADLYDLGATSFITKPAGFAALVEVVRALRRYWSKL